MRRAAEAEQRRKGREAGLGAWRTCARAVGGGGTGDGGAAQGASTEPSGRLRVGSGSRGRG